MNFKRKRPRASTGSKRGRGYWMRCWPAWHDVIFHRRKPRRRDKAREHAVVAGTADPDNIAWETGNHRPHVCFW